MTNDKKNDKRSLVGQVQAPRAVLAVGSVEG